MQYIRVMSRYEVPQRLDQIGEEGQNIIRKARVLVVGCGGLGVPVIQYLAGAGVGTLGLVDPDVVELSNLHRQIIYTEADIGKKKAECASAFVGRLNSEVKVDCLPIKLQEKNAQAIISNYHVVVEASDNLATKYLVNDIAVLTKKALVIGGIEGNEGMVGVLNVNGGPNYRDLFPDGENRPQDLNCATVGMSGPLAGVLGSIMAGEVLNQIIGIKGLTGKVLWYDMNLGFVRTIAVSKNEMAEPIEKKFQENMEHVNEMTVQELKKLMDEGTEFKLIDVREPDEVAIVTLGAQLIPVAKVLEHVDDFVSDKTIVHCRSGARSASAILALQRVHGIENLYNLKGGILAWAKEIDPSMPTY